MRKRVRYPQNLSKTATVIKKRHHNQSGCDGALLLVHFGIRDIAGADHGLQRQSHAKLEADGEGR